MSLEPAEKSPEGYHYAHEAIGYFIVHCSLMDYRAGQLIARWFCSGDNLKYLSYVLHGMSFRDKKLILAERISGYLPIKSELLKVIDEADLIMQRRELVTRGLLSRSREGAYCIKSFSATRFLQGEGEEDILLLSELQGWSDRAKVAGEKLVELADLLRRAPTA